VKKVEIIIGHIVNLGKVNFLRDRNRNLEFGLFVRQSWCYPAPVVGEEDA
jgi:hypothetical protein